MVTLHISEGPGFSPGDHTRCQFSVCLKFVAHSDLEPTRRVPIESRQIKRAIQPVRRVVPLGVCPSVEHIENPERCLQRMWPNVEVATNLKLQETRRFVA